VLSTADICEYDNSSWMPVRTKPRAEKVLARFCQSHGLRYYLPLQRQIRRYQRQTVERFLPMFAGYIFVCIDEAELQILQRSNKVATILRVDALQQQGLIAELQEIHRLEQLQATAQLQVMPELVPGKPVRVAHGPLQGLNGVIMRRQNQLRVCVNVEMLGQSVSF